MAFRHGAITAALEAVFLETVPLVGRRDPWLGSKRPKIQQTGKSQLKVESILSSSPDDICGDANRDVP